MHILNLKGLMLCFFDCSLSLTTLATVFIYTDGSVNHTKPVQREQSGRDVLLKRLRATQNHSSPDSPAHRFGFKSRKKCTIGFIQAVCLTVRTSFNQDSEIILGQGLRRKHEIFSLYDMNNTYLVLLMLYSRPLYATHFLCHMWSLRSDTEFMCDP